MIPRWKLPKDLRTSVNSEIADLRHRILDLELTIIRDEDRLFRLKGEVIRNRKELDKLETEYPDKIS